MRYTDTHINADNLSSLLHAYTQDCAFKYTSAPSDTSNHTHIRKYSLICKHSLLNCTCRLLHAYICTSTNTQTVALTKLADEVNFLAAVVRCLPLETRVPQDVATPGTIQRVPHPVGITHVRAIKPGEWACRRIQTSSHVSIYPKSFGATELVQMTQKSYVLTPCQWHQFTNQLVSCNLYSDLIVVLYSNSWEKTI